MVWDTFLMPARIDLLITAHCIVDGRRKLSYHFIAFVVAILLIHKAKVITAIRPTRRRVSGKDGRNRKRLFV